MATTLQPISITTDLTSICLSFLTRKMWTMLFSHHRLMENSDTIKIWHTLIDVKAFVN